MLESRVRSRCSFHGNGRRKKVGGEATMPHVILIFLFLQCLFFGYGLHADNQARVESVRVKTRAPSNRTVTFWYRVPSSYRENSGRSYRVLVIFGGRNTQGKAEVSGKLEWPQWADQQEIFLLAPGYEDDNYWEPREWSGKALMTALRLIREKYPVCTDKLLYYGYSAGSQCSNLFPAWKPEYTRAWVSHACGVFHEPSARMRNVPGLVTCGDADMARYIISRNFVENCRKKGIHIIWKSFPNHPHDVPPDSLKLARAFLAYYHTLYLSDLDRLQTKNTKKTEDFIGDDLEGKFYPADSPKAQNILFEDRVPLPSREIAEAWGKSGK